MTFVDSSAAPVARVVTEERPATLFGCQWVILRGTELPPPMTCAPGQEDWHHPLRLDRDGRVICYAGLPQPDEETAREWAGGDIARLAEAEESHFRRTGSIPGPLLAVRLTAGGVPWEPEVALDGDEAPRASNGR